MAGTYDISYKNNTEIFRVSGCTQIALLVQMSQLELVKIGTFGISDAIQVSNYGNYVVHMACKLNFTTGRLRLQ